MKERSLERQAQYCREAAERLRNLLEKEEEQKALATWAEQERKRQAIIEAESSGLNVLFGSRGKPDQEDA